MSGWSQDLGNIQVLKPFIPFFHLILTRLLIGAPTGCQTRCAWWEKTIFIASPCSFDMASFQPCSVLTSSYKDFLPAARPIRQAFLSQALPTADPRRTMQGLALTLLCSLKITRGGGAGTLSQRRFVLFVHQPRRRYGEKGRGCSACLSNASPPHPLLSVNSNSYQDTLGEKLSPWKASAASQCRVPLPAPLAWALALTLCFHLEQNERAQ